ncbi:MAG TPA: restriction endonuclease subunit S, partial [Thermodesulfobacteriota bacterium]|nr:restriction endonuclease subunit S [Thermodesulfobacteriota bacterium]
MKTTKYSWKKLKWGDLATLEYGKGLRGYQNTEGTYPVYGTNGQIGWHKEPLCHKHGIIIGRKGAYRGIHYSSKPFFVIDTAFYLNPITDSFDVKWAYYQLLDFDINSLDSGSAIPSTSRDAFYQIRVNLPPLSTQRKIASILSAYDDLIENNTRRIQILEEMAQAIYKEWFVNFRFPGHEKVKIVESDLGLIPEGWEINPFLEIAEFVNGFAFKPHHWGNSGKPIVKIAELKSGITEKTPFYSGHDIPTKFHVKNGDVLFSWSADLDVYIWSHGEACLNQHIFNVLPKRGYTKLFLFYSLKNRMQEFRSKSLGTTMRHIKRSALAQVKFVVPSTELRDLFESYAQPMIQEILNLTSKNNILRRTRDLILPKLISGEIDVE